MTDSLTIDRIVARSHGADGVSDRIERIIRRVAEDRLDRMLTAFPLVTLGDWCVPTVKVAAVLDLDRPDSALEEAVARAVLDAIADALHDAAAVHYAGAIDALAALITAAAARRFPDAWMWAQMGFIAGAGELSRDPTACVVQALAGRPECAVPAVARAIHLAGFAAVHRLLTESGWIALARNVIDNHAVVTMRDPLLMEDSSPADRVEHSSARTNGSTTKPATAELSTASRIITGSQLAAAARGSRIRLSEPMLRALSVLTVAESEPAALCRRTAPTVCRSVARILSGAAAVISDSNCGATEIPPRGRQPQAAAAPGTASVAPQALVPFEPPAGDARGPAVSDAAAADRAGTRAAAAVGEETAVGAETAWAGLLFLLNVADDADMPVTLLTDPVLEGISASELIARVAMVLLPAVAPDDPAVLAFAGADPSRTRRTWKTPLAGVLVARIEGHAAAWALAVAERMYRTDDPAGCVADIACRTGTIVREPGWIDVHLDLQEVDIDIRRAGLDVDPGWVRWLGAVVRFCYA